MSDDDPQNDRKPQGSFKGAAAVSWLELFAILLAAAIMLLIAAIR